MQLVIFLTKTEIAEPLGAKSRTENLPSELRPRQNSFHCKCNKCSNDEG